jgi:hypothetical protein
LARGRKALAWALAIFLFVQIAVGLGLDNFWPNLRFPNAAFALGEYQPRAHLAGVVCLGSSRMGMCFRAAEIAQVMRERCGNSAIEAYNLSLPRGDLLTDDYLLEELLPRGVAPKLIVVEVSPESLARYNEWLDSDIRNLLTWADVPRLVREFRYLGAPQRRSLFLSRLMPVYQYRTDLKRKIFSEVCSSESPKQKNRSLSLTVSRLDSTSSEAREAFDWSAVYARLMDPAMFAGNTQLMLPGLRTWLKQYQIGGFSARALTRLAHRARRAGSQLVLVGMPVTASYRQCYTPEVQRAYAEFMQQFTRNYDCRFVDYQDLLPDSDFWDGYHALESGGMRFSRRLAVDVLAPMWHLSPANSR